MTPRYDELHDDAMAALVRALETAPDIQAPNDFALRVMARLPQKPRIASLQRARALTPRYGRTAVYCALGILLVAMLLTTRLSGESHLWPVLQLVLLLQLAAYALWLGFASWRSQ